MNRTGLILSLILGLLAFGLDRLHKYLQVDMLRWPEGHFAPVLPFLDIGLVYNPGVSYGMLSGLPVWAIALVIAVALGALVAWWLRSASLLVRCGLAICIGGAASNALDRLIFPGVADFFWLHFGGMSLFIFNLADAAISVGVGLLLLDLLGIGKHRATNPA